MFPSSSPDPRWVSPRRHVVRIVVRPHQLIDAARRFSLAATVTGTSCRRLGAATSAVRLNPADPGLAGLGSAGLRCGVGLVAEVIDGLAAEARRMEQVAGELAATVSAAAGADAGGYGGLDLPLVDRSRFVPFLPGSVLPDPRSVDRLAAQLSVMVTRHLLSRVELLHDAWEVGRPRWRGARRPRPSSPTTSAPTSVFGRRTIGWLGPGRPGDAAGERPLGLDAHRARGARAVAGALALTADEHWIRPDEIGLIDHGDGVYTVVLPGVTDLSRPASGWNPDHRSVRDLDMAALESARSSAVADNRYARIVADALDHSGVEPGARLTVVGHSYGADTALDLAADRRFNGRRYQVENVVAAGYYSQPQLRQVPPSTNVLVLQNRRDVVIEAERVGRWATAPMETLAATVVGAAAIGNGTGRAVVVGFNGGNRGAGHHPENYRRFVLRAGARTSPAGTGPIESMGQVDRFLAEVGAGPWGTGGRLDAVNVSVRK